LVRKVLSLKLFDDGDGGLWKKSVKDVKGGILAVSQFTLYAVTDKGAKPDFHEAMKTEEARKFFEQVVSMFKNNYPDGIVQTGSFGDFMNVEIINDGPTTIILESPVTKDKN
jgi:D-tyrosyl-tRNA(Tyr) deacylase